MHVNVNWADAAVDIAEGCSRTGVVFSCSRDACFSALAIAMALDMMPVLALWAEIRSGSVTSLFVSESVCK